MPTMVHLPTDLNVQLGATQEHPSGRVKQLKAGWVELDEELESHPVLSRLIPQTDKGKSRQEKLLKAEEDRNKKIAEAEGEFLKIQQECQQESVEEEAKLSEDYGKKVDEAGLKGHVVQQTHPMPSVARAQALTAEPSAVVPSASFEQKPLSLEEGKKMQEALPSEKDRQELQENQKDNEKKSRETLEDPAESTAASSSGAKGGKAQR
jgi:hypothetical protein